MRAVALSLSAAAVVAIATAWACLPDLVITPVPSVGPFCGDGVITPDGGPAGEQCDPGPDASLAALQACPQCVVVCKVGDVAFTDQASNHCYFSLGNSKGGIDGGGGSCEENGAHIVRFVSEAEVAFVESQPGTEHWIGLEDLTQDGTWFPSEATNEPGWSAECPGCFAHVAADATDIPFVDAGRRCVVGDPASGAVAPVWTQSGCLVARNTLCEREPLGTRTAQCDAGACFTVAATQTTKHYVILPNPKIPADEAAQGCRGIDGGLVVFESREEREQVGYEIGAEVVRGGANDFWIGLSSNDAGVWSWDPGAQGLTPLPWGLSEPAPTTVPNARAYVVVEAGTLDSELAHAQTDAAEKHYAVCELR